MMSKSRSKLLLTSLIFSSIAFAQEIEPLSGVNITPDDGFSSSGFRPQGFFTDDLGSRFFEILRSSHHVSEAPLSFEETVEQSAVIARGYLVEVIPGRAFTNQRRPAIPPIQTILLKIQTSSLLKGSFEQLYFVEYYAPWSAVSELSEILYSRELLFLLRPGTTYYNSAVVEISNSREAEIELSNDPPLYMFTLESSLFTMSASGNLTSPIDISREFNDLYTNINSLTELATHITEIQYRSLQDFP